MKFTNKDTRAERNECTDAFNLASIDDNLEFETNQIWICIKCNECSIGATGVEAHDCILFMNGWKVHHNSSLGL